jgi:Tol biopolymer transport system component
MRLFLAPRVRAASRLRLGLAVGLSVVPAAFAAGPTAYQTAKTTRLSVSSSGAQGNRASFEAAMSADGRVVAFSSQASNLVPGDTNRTLDVFAHDRRTRETTRVSVSSSGRQASGASQNVAVSADGRFVAFSSAASDLVPGDTNGAWDVFTHDRVTGRTTRVSVSSSGAPARRTNAGSFFPAISADGRFVAFSSYAPNLVRADTNRSADVFVHDRRSGRTTRVSVSSSGAQANRGTGIVALSAGGRFLAFESAASNLVRGDTNGRQDVFVHDRRTGRTTRASVSSAGVQGTRASFSPDISGDGRLVTFESLAPNLVAGDTNRTVDAFLHDRVSGRTRRISVSSTGKQGDRGNLVATISADGRFVALGSRSTNLVPGDTNGRPDVFARGPLH